MDAKFCFESQGEYPFRVVLALQRSSTCFVTLRLCWLQSLKHLSKQSSDGVQLEHVKSYYDMLIAKYLPCSNLRF